MLESNPINVIDMERQAEHLLKHISKACDTVMCRKKQGAKIKPAYWWNKEI